MTPAIRPARFLGVVLVGVGTGCAGRARPPTTVPPALAACPAPPVSAGDWTFRADSIGVFLFLPPDFLERPSGGTYREWIGGSERNQLIQFGLIRGDLPIEGYRRVITSTFAEEYSECHVTVDGYTVHLQAWRTPNGVFRNFRRQSRYDGFAIWQLEPGVFAYLQGGGSDRATQAVLLAAARLWRSGAAPATPNR